MMYNINESGKFAIAQYRNSYKFQYHINNVINHALISKSPTYEHRLSFIRAIKQFSNSKVYHFEFTNTG